MRPQDTLEASLTQEEMWAKKSIAYLRTEIPQEPKPQDWPETADNNNEKRAAVSVILRFARAFLPGDFVASGFEIRFGPALFFGFLFVKQFFDADIQQEKSKTPL